MARKYLLTLAMFASGAISSPAAAETLGTLSYTPPPGWELVEQDAGHAVYRRTLSDGAASARITVFADRPVSAGTFETAWREAGTIGGKVTRLGGTRAAGGLTMREAFVAPTSGTQGYLTLAEHRVGTCAARVVLLVEPSAKAAAFGSDLSAVLASLRHAPSCGEAVAVRSVLDPEPGERAPGFDLPVEGSGPGRPATLVGGWQRVGAAPRSFRPGSGGGSEARYTFGAEGLYTYSGVSRGITDPSSWLQRSENGNYLLIGNTVRIVPRECRIEVHSGTRDGPVERSEACNADPQLYKATWVWLEAAEQWRLVLEPDRETERDGPFGGLAEHPDGYAFKAVP